ncbi:pyruvate kinase [candidate division KSB1 bacterium]|nr:pyruvate kinase [candidate division KSB1 bacterium]TDJ00991.1 MAG: pyruvate kinase [Caldithrix sp.]
MRRTKIVCTIGPASDSEEMLGKLMDAGMNVARLNFSHGTHEQHHTVIGRIRKVATERDNPIAILQDLAGPKIRIRDFKEGSINLTPGETFTLTTENLAGDKSRVSVTYSKLPQEVKADDVILLADGSIQLQVTKIDSSNIVCEVVIGGELSSKKGINLPGSSLSVEALTAKDRVDLKFGLEQNVDYVAMSFVRRQEDIQQITKVMRENKKPVPIIAKIEKHEAIENIDGILEVVDGIMVARGDLAVETPLETVPLAQKMLIRKCNQAGKPVITATQMLKSMVDNPRPTRAEANDVANAVIDGTDAVMLSEETTIGEFPVETVETMTKIIEVTESSEQVEHQRFRHDYTESTSIAHAVSHAAYEMAKDLKAAAILTPTQSGSTTRMVSSYRPDQVIIALCPNETVVRRLNLIWGVYPFLADGYLTVEEMIEQAKDKALTSGLVNFNDVLVITAGVPIGIAGTTNLIKAEILK